MKALFFFVTLFLMALASQVFAADNCFVVKSSEWGKFCEGKPESLSITVTNTCEKPYVLSICIEQKSGEWKCELTDAFEPGAEKTYGVCEATGNYKLAQCYRLKNCSALEAK
jgi:hypothetical protein